MNKEIKRMPPCGSVRCYEGVLYDLSGNVIGICKLCEKVEKMMIQNEDFVLYCRNGRVLGYEYLGKGDSLEIINQYKLTI